MILMDELDKIRDKLAYEFEDDEIMIRIHFIREIMDKLRKQYKNKTSSELAMMTRQIQKDWKQAKANK